MVTKHKSNKNQKPTALQDRFIHFYTSPGDGFFNGTESASLAGYAGSRINLANVARANLKRPYILSRIDRIIKTKYSSKGLTLDKVLDDLEMTRVLAIADKQYSVAAKCSEMHGKYLAMWTDKIERIHTVETVSVPDLVEIAMRLSGKIDGINIVGGSGADGAGKSGESTSASNAGTGSTH